MHTVNEQSGLTSASPKCPHCKQDQHKAGPCPHVSAVEYYPDGSVKRVEYVIAHIEPVPVKAPEGVTPFRRPAY